MSPVLSGYPSLFVSDQLDWAVPLMERLSAQVEFYVFVEDANIIDLSLVQHENKTYPNLSLDDIVRRVLEAKHAENSYGWLLLDVEFFQKQELDDFVKKIYAIEPETILLIRSQLQKNWCEDWRSEPRIFFYDSAASAESILQLLQLIIREVNQAAQLRQLTEKLAMSEKRADLDEKIIDAATGLIRLDQNNIILSANQSAVDILGVPMWTLIGQSVLSVLKLSTLTEEEQAVRFKHQNGRLIWLAIKPLKVSGFGNENDAYVLLEDITEHKSRERVEEYQHYQEGVAKAKSEIRHNIGNSLNSLNATVSEVVEMIQFYQAEKDYLEAFVKQNLDREQEKSYQFLRQLTVSFPKQSYLQLVEAGQTLEKDMKTLIHFFDRSPVKARQPDQLVETVELSAIIESVVSSVSSFFTQQGVGIRFMSIENNLLLKVNQNELFHALLNLMINAAEAIEERAQKETMVAKLITVKAFSNPEGAVEIDVHDTAGSILKANAKSIFEQGYTTKQEGTGEGLHSVANFMRIVGGEISVESSPESGTTFKLLFPKNLVKK